MSRGDSIAERLSVWLLVRSYPRQRIRAILERTGLQSRRVRALPAEDVVYYMIAWGLFNAVSTGEVLRSFVGAMRWLGGGQVPRVAGKAAISRARSRLGAAPLKALWEESARPLGRKGQPGCFYRGLRLMAVRSDTLNLPATAENLAHFARPSSDSGETDFARLRFVSLFECGPRAILAVRMGATWISERALAAQVVSHLKPGMLCLADGGGSSFGLWQNAASTGADLLWRTRSNAPLPVEKVLEDGSCLVRISPSEQTRRERNGKVVRVIESEFGNTGNGEPVCRLITTLLDPKRAPSLELAALYSQSCGIAGVLEECKTHLQRGQITLRSKTPELIAQEFYGLMLAHRAVRALMNEAAMREEPDSGRLSSRTPAIK